MLYQTHVEIGKLERHGSEKNVSKAKLHEYSRCNVVQLLLNAGANPNIQNMVRPLLVCCQLNIIGHTRKN